MEVVEELGDIFVRVDPGEPLIATLLCAAQKLGIACGPIVSGVGMLMNVDFGFFDADSDDYKIRPMSGVFDVSVITGSVVERDGEYAAHVHVVMNDERQVTYSGHLIEATCHITMEVFLSRTALNLKRVRLPDYPATRLVVEDRK